MANLVRTRQGSMIHVAGCRFGANGTPWLWASDKSADTIASTIIFFGYETCLACQPLPHESIRKPKLKP